jgi:hypothetical protein
MAEVLLIECTINRLHRPGMAEVLLIECTINRLHRPGMAEVLLIDCNINRLSVLSRILHSRCTHAALKLY